MSSSRMVTLTTFSNPIEAELARNRLEEEGIRAFLSGEAANSMFGAALGLTIALNVAETDAEKASQVLGDFAPPDLRREFLADAERAGDTGAEEESTAIRTPEWASTEVPDPDDPEARYRTSAADFQAVNQLSKEERIQGFKEPRRRARAFEQPEGVWKPNDFAALAWKAAILALGGLILVLILLALSALH